MEPIIINQISVEGKTYTISPALTIEPRLRGWLLEWDNDELGIYAWAEDRESLTADVLDELAFRIRTYVLPDPWDFAPDALALRAALESRIKLRP